VGFNQWDIIYSVGKQTADSIAGNTRVVNGRPYSVFGSYKNKTSFHVHFLGACLGNNFGRHSKHSVCELLHNKLDESGFKHTIYDWGQSVQSSADCITRFIRDVSFHKIDLLILYSGIIDPLTYSTLNVLPTKAGSVWVVPSFVKHVDSSGVDVSNGINHEIDLISIGATQHGMLGALARRHDFAFWDVIAATSDTMVTEKSMALKGLTPGFFQRKTATKEKLLAVLDNRYSKDYTDTFSQIDDVFSLFADGTHYTDKACRLVAERFAADILKEFGNKPERDTLWKS
jgi:hypothetical protein